MKIKRFGENSDNKWYELTDGTRVKCGEDTIHALWQRWVVGEVKRYYEKGFLVFEFENLNSDKNDAESDTTEAQ